MVSRLAPAQSAIKTAGITTQWISEEENHSFAPGNISQGLPVTMPFDFIALGFAIGFQGVLDSRATGFPNVQKMHYLFSLYALFKSRKKILEHRFGHRYSLN